MRGRLFLAAPPLLSAGLASAAFLAPPAQPCLVLLREGVDPRPAALAIGARRVYSRALRGFAVDLTARQAALLRSDARVRGIYRDGEARLPPALVEPPALSPSAPGRPRRQVVPTGIARCGARARPSARIDGVDDGIDADVAVIDTGIDTRHPDLRVVGGFSVFSRGSFADPHGHGTHVAGTIGALDNGIGVVGVAPGVRLWAVRVLNRAGRGRWSDVIAGLDWVAANSRTIDVANMSIAGGIDDETPLREAIDECVARGVVMVVAAGNDRLNVDLQVPSRFESVVVVSALADSNGVGGPGAGRFRVSPGYVDEDESFARFSNFGAKVHLIAPGVRILSTWRNRKYALATGTSQAAPHVAGAAALYRAANPGAAPVEVRDALIRLGSTFEPPDDPDGIHEPALDVSGI